MSASVQPPAAPPPPRPAAAYQRDQVVGRPPKQGGSRTRLLIAVGAVAVLALSILTIAVLASGRDDKDAPVVQGGGNQPHAIATALAGRQAANFEIVSGAETITVKTADLGEDLYRASTPKDGSLVPQAVVQGDDVKLSLVSSGAAGNASAEVLLNQKVKWKVKLAGGGMKEIIDFSSGQITGLELGAGAGEIEVTLPKAVGLLAVKLTGGAGQLKVHAAQGQPVQVKIGGTAGAGVVTVDGKTKNGVKGGSDITPADWAKATDKYSIEAAVGVSALIVDRR